MTRKLLIRNLVLPYLILGGVTVQTAVSQHFKWPEGKKMAISLTFDDARGSQATAGVPLLNEYGVKGTFYLVPSAVKTQLEGWKKAVAAGHEMGNHSLHHPCSGNFVWSREKALETYTLDKMRTELTETNRQIRNLLGVTPVSYAYPCGHTFIGRGRGTRSFVPLISEMFVSGRGWLDEAPVDPSYCDFAQLTGMETDGKDFEQILPIIDAARKAGQWLVLAGHEMADSGPQTTRLTMLRKLCAYAKDPANGIWIAPVSEIAAYVKSVRDTINIPELVAPDGSGTLYLTAENGKGVGPRIEYMPRWKAFGWFTSADMVEWEIEVAKTGNYDVNLEWSVDDKEAGKAFVLEASGTSLRGQVEKSGGWERFKSKSVGKVRLDAGIQKIKFRPDKVFNNGALADLRKIVLTPVD
ncbi:polysaccharide deacetylase family protein [Dyadobacter sp. 676]|uniref:Polysaccharide deacetylase family protein n=1 Tax=Dyadobacter sp. 676 TaxID=3088362 RepID=A0AAU8FKR7_9BACT